MRSLLDERVMATQRVSINAQIVPTNQGMLDAVADNANAIGFTSFGSLDGNVIGLAIDGITPTSDSLTAQQYPLSTPLYFVSQTEPIGEARGFLAWLQNEGQIALVSKFGTVK